MTRIEIERKMRCKNCLKASPLNATKDPEERRIICGERSPVDGRLLVDPEDRCWSGAWLGLRKVGDELIPYTLFASSMIDYPIDNVIAVLERGGVPWQPIPNLNNSTDG